MQGYKTQSPDFAPLNTANGSAKIEKKEETNGDKPDVSKEEKAAMDQLNAVEGGNFKDIRKAINLSDNPAQQQRLQNKLNKLELKKGFKAEELKAKGEKQIARMTGVTAKAKEIRKREKKQEKEHPGLKAQLQKEAQAEIERGPTHSTIGGDFRYGRKGELDRSISALQPLNEMPALQTGQMSAKKAKEHEKMKRIASSLPHADQLQYQNLTANKLRRKGEELEKLMKSKPD